MKSQRILFMVGMILILMMNVSQSSSYFYDDVYITFNGSDYNDYDQKLYIIVDIDSSGNLLYYYMLEMEDRDDIIIYEGAKPGNAAPHMFPYIESSEYIIVATVTADDSNLDDFSLQISVTDSGTTNSESARQFGDSTNGDYRHAVFSLTGSYLSPTLVSAKRNDGQIEGDSSFSTLFNLINTYYDDYERGQDDLANHLKSYTFPV